MIDCTGIQSSVSLLLAQSIWGRPCHCRNDSWFFIVYAFQKEAESRNLVARLEHRSTETLFRWKEWEKCGSEMLRWREVDRGRI